MVNKERGKGERKQTKERRRKKSTKKEGRTTYEVKKEKKVTRGKGGKKIRLIKKA